MEDDDVLCPLKFMKHDWFEKKGDEIAVHLYVKDVTKCDVEFTEDVTIIKFSTSNDSFLKIHKPKEKAEKQVLFTYSIFTREKILPERSKFIVRKAFIELTIIKKVPLHWGSLETKMTITDRSKLSCHQSLLQDGQLADPININNSIHLHSDSQAPTVNSDNLASRPESVETQLNSDLNENKGQFTSSPVGSSSPQIMQLLGGKSTPTLKNQGEQESKVETVTTNSNQPSTVSTAQEMEKQKNLNKITVNKSESVGLTGLENYANNCYMNVVVQVLANIREVRDYFLDDHYVDSVCVNNPMSSGGRVTKAFSEVVKALWSNRKTVRPHDLKNVMAKRCPSFMGFQQCDAQEFFSTLLDNLHEDLNQSVNQGKMNEVVTKDDDGPTSNEKPDTSWDAHIKRNNSIIVKLFHGQMVSKLTCLVCHKRSTIYDPCAQISLPIAMVKHRLRVFVFLKDPSKQPIITRLQISSPSAQIWHVTNSIERRLNIPAHCLRVFQFSRGYYLPNFDIDAPIDTVRSPGFVVACEVRDEKEADSISLPFIQCKPPLQKMSICDNCKKSQCELESKLKRCTRCMHVAYCSKNCQARHWGIHQKNCRRGYREQIGLPFFLTIKKSKLNYDALLAIAMAYGSLSLNKKGSIQKNIESSEAYPEEITNQTDTNQNVASEKSEEKDQIDAKPCKGDNCDEPVKNLENNSNNIHSIECTEHEREEKSRNSEGACKSTGKSNETCLIKAYTKPDQEPITITTDDFKMDLLLSASYLSLEWQNVNAKEKDLQQLIASANALEDNLLDDDDSKSNHCSIEDCLSLFMEPERLPECWKCSRCKTVQPAKKEIALSYPPPVILFHFKRFAYSAYGQKINRSISYPLSGLDLSPYMAEGTKDRLSINPVYDLTGVICHVGSMRFGHYTCMVQSLGHQGQTDLGWRYFDDDEVRKIDVGNVISPNAYVLVYRMRDMARAISLETPFPLVDSDLKQDKVPKATLKIGRQLSAESASKERLKSDETAVQQTIRRSISVDALKDRKSADQLIVSHEAFIDKDSCSNHDHSSRYEEDLCKDFTPKLHDDVLGETIKINHRIIDDNSEEMSTNAIEDLPEMSTHSDDCDDGCIINRQLPYMNIPADSERENITTLQPTHSLSPTHVNEKYATNANTNVDIDDSLFDYTHRSYELDTENAKERKSNIFDGTQESNIRYQPFGSKNVNDIMENELD